MSELQFPKDPIVGQEYDFPPYRYYWDGVKWKTKGIGYNPVNELRDELESRISNSESKVFESLKRSYADVGLNLVEGSFEEGGELLVASDVMITASGAGYSWAGTFPKVVAAGATPATSGGVGAGAWVDRTGVTLRGDLAAVTGASLVNTSTGETVEYRLSDMDSSLSSIGASLSGKANLAGSASQTFSVADATNPHHAVSYEQYLTTPTDTIAGIVRRATNAEEVAGNSDVGFLTPLGLRNAFNASGNAPVYACRSWVNFDGTGTISIRGSGNVSSLTDNGTGDYLVNFTTSMPDINYAAAGLAGQVISHVAIRTFIELSVKATSSVRVKVNNTSSTYVDINGVDVAVFR